MSAKITDNTNQIILEITRNSSLALRYMTDEIQAIAEPRTPKQKGDLRRNVLKTVVGLSGKIKWAQKYASRQEGGKGITRYTTSGTGPHYAENAVIAVTKSPEAVFKKARLI